MHDNRYNAIFLEWSNENTIENNNIDDNCGGNAGISLYYILTDHFPFHHQTPQDLIKAFLKEKNPEDPLAMIFQHKKELESSFISNTSKSILEEDRIPVQCYRKDLPSELAEIINKSVKQNKDERFGSAREMRGALLKQFEAHGQMLAM